MRDKNGKFIKGNPGKPKGATSQKTTEIRESFKMLIENNLHQLEDDLSKLKPKERLEMIVSLSSFVIPKLKATEMTVEDISKSEWKPIQIHFSDDDN